MDKQVPKHKGVYILPNLFTSASLFAGLLSLLWASSGLFERAAVAIFFSAIMDGLDGKVARLTGTTSAFGVQYDSLADLVAFGVTPAFLIYHFYLVQFHRIGVAVVFLFAVCGALRLARFNVAAAGAVASKKFFTGLPIPAAGCTVASLVFFHSVLPVSVLPVMPYVGMVLSIGVALLMVSRIRYASFKEFGFIKTHPFRTMVTAIVIFALVVASPKVFLFLFLLGYAISGLIYTFIYLPRMSNAANRAASAGESQTKS